MIQRKLVSSLERRIRHRFPLGTFDATYTGYVRPAAVALTPPSSFIPSLKSIYCIVGDGTCDIGKGWLTAAVGGCLIKDSDQGEPLVIKIDPMLNAGFPETLGITCDGVTVSDDFLTYQKVGLTTVSEQNIVMGLFMQHYLTTYSSSPLIGPGEVKKQTQADMSALFSQTLIDLAQRHRASHVIIEIGGITSDNENAFIPDALRLLSVLTGITPHMILLTEFRHIPNTGRYVEEIGKKAGIKTQLIRTAVRGAIRKYAQLPLAAVFVRRGNVPHRIPQSLLDDELQRVAYECQLHPDILLFEDDYRDVLELRDFVKKSRILGKPQPIGVLTSGREPNLPHIIGNLSREKGLLLPLPPDISELSVICRSKESFAVAVSKQEMDIVDNKGDDVTQKVTNWIQGLLTCCLKNNIRAVRIGDIDTSLLRILEDILPLWGISTAKI